MPLFLIETYKVSSYLARPVGPAQPSRLLEMAGPVAYHGIRDRAAFHFSPAFDGAWSSPVAGYLTEVGYTGRSIVGWFPLAEFAVYYDILRSERPVHVSYEFSDGGARTGYLRRVGLGTSTEPIGEGPSESVERISASLAERLTLVTEGLSAGAVPMPVAGDLPKEAHGAPRPRPGAADGAQDEDAG